MCHYYASVSVIAIQKYEGYVAIYASGKMIGVKFTKIVRTDYWKAAKDSRDLKTKMEAKR
jgi:hypothetical protein